MKAKISYSISLICALACFIAFPLGAESLRISQIDPSTLLLNQEVKVYLSVTDDKGAPVDNIPASRFKIFESADGTTYREIPKINSFKTMANYESGISFLLLIDNSGSMYRDIQGKRVRSESTARISGAKRAVRIFLNSVSNPKDRVGLVSYNTYYTIQSELEADKSKVERLLEEIKKPTLDEAYTEIYASLYKAVEEFRAVKGRKVIIILSDGENQPYYLTSKKPHRDFGTKTYEYTEPIRYCQEEGISVFAVNFGREEDRKDKKLRDIAIQTGGSVFDARNELELAGVYSTIVKQILHEYLAAYNATMEPADRKYVKVQFDTGKEIISTVRFYFSSTVFGMPLKNFSLMLLIPLLLAFAFAWLLTRFKFVKEKSLASLEVINPGPARQVTKVLTLSKGRTIIGGTAKADMTIIGGVSQVKEKHATIIFDDKKKKYTIAGDGPIKVNNKSVTTKVLESGDVINVGGTTIVFDDGDV